MAGPMGGGTQSALMQLMRNKKSTEQINDPGSLGGIGSPGGGGGKGLFSGNGPAAQTLSAVGSVGGPLGSAAASAYNGAAGLVEDGMNAPYNALQAAGRAARGAGPRIANTIQGGPGAGLQSALVNAMNQPAIGGAAPKPAAPENATVDRSEGFDPNMESQMLQAIAGSPTRYPPAPPAPVSGPQPQGTTPGTPAPGQPFRSEDLAAPVGPNMNKQRRRPGII